MIATPPILAQLFAVASVSVTIHRGSTALGTFQALIGSTALTAETDEGSVLTGRTIDFIFPAAALAAAGVAIAPQDRIARTIGDDMHWFEVLPRANDPAQGSVDPPGELVRVHCRLQVVEDV